MANVIADYHGVLTREKDQGPLLEYVAKQAVTPIYAALAHPVRTAAFAKAKPRLENAVQAYEEGEIPFDEMMGIYNELILRHLPRDTFVMKRIEESARSEKTQRNLDVGNLTAIKDNSDRRAILSTGSRDFIIAAVDTARYGIKYVIANPILNEGHGSRFVLYVTPESKPDRIKELFMLPEWKPAETVYIGDNCDEEAAFAFVRGNGGRVVVSQHASDDFKQYAAVKFNAATPRDSEELARFLKSLRA